MLPHEPLSSHDHPEGIRMGVQEMTRFGMGEKEMVRIAELILECLRGANGVQEEVHRFRGAYQQIRYCFDPAR
jgi:glycine hydroxymethyltransferase